MRAKRVAKALVAFFLPVGLIMTVNAGLGRLTAAGHHLQFVRQWRLGTRVRHADRFGERINCHFHAGEGLLLFGKGWTDLSRWTA